MEGGDGGEEGVEEAHGGGGGGLKRSGEWERKEGGKGENEGGKGGNTARPYREAPQNQRLVRRVGRTARGVQRRQAPEQRVAVEQSPRCSGAS